jgi:methionine-rich copper-binding protein CopC
MTMRNTILKFVASVAFALAATAAFAHAQLEKATPGVGATVASASEIRLKFSEGVEPRFSRISLTAADGAAVPLGAANTQPGDATVFVAPIAKPLAPGVYTVHWSAVSVDTHHTQGDFQFTVKP